MKALSISVYRNPTYKGCSNGGITEQYNNLLLICDDGNTEVDESNPPHNLVKIVTRQLFGRAYKHIEPYDAPEGVGWMAGGSLAYTSDGRFRKLSEYPLSVHDRQETQEQYDMLSR